MYLVIEELSLKENTGFSRSACQPSFTATSPKTYPPSNLSELAECSLWAEGIGYRATELLALVLQSVKELLSHIIILADTIISCS